MSKERNIRTLPLDGGCHCFNFINTVHSRKEEYIFDYLNIYDDLLEWSDKVKLLPKERLRQLGIYAKKNSKNAERKLVEIKNKRELLYYIFSSLIHAKTVEVSSAQEFNNTLSDSLSNLTFRFNNGKPYLGWNENEVNLMEPLWAVIKDAFDIITSLPLSRVKECDACGWVFLDKSKNNSRVWCNMQTCGSIDKSKRYYYRKKRKN